METLISQLFAARDTAHRLHLRTRSFAAHMALGDLYEGLLNSADALAEAYQGKYGIMNIPNPTFTFSDTDQVSFVRELAQWAENSRGTINPADTNLVNEWDLVLGIVYKAKYKLENFS